jgi:hypothetical protein
MIAGCTGANIDEGMGTGQPPPSFTEEMQRESKNMQMLKYGEKAAIAKQTKQAKTEPEKKTGP